MQIILIEGMPGCGKSTLTNTLEKRLAKQDIRAQAYSELAKTHPIFSLRFGDIDVHDPRYLDADLERWQIFLDRNKNDQRTYIFDAAPFQNSIRYAFEANFDDQIPIYYSKLQKLWQQTQTHAKLIYLQPENIANHTDWCISNKGALWAKNVSKYIESTPYAQKRDLQGVTGMKQFWNDYVCLCNALLKETRIPVKEIISTPYDWRTTKFAENTSAFLTVNYLEESGKMSSKS